MVGSNPSDSQSAPGRTALSSGEGTFGPKETEGEGVGREEKEDDEEEEEETENEEREEEWR